MTQKQRKQEGEKIRILFISIKNNTRIQIAERFLKHSAPFVFEVFSEGITCIRAQFLCCAGYI